jgi:hypothetical protein
LHDFTADGGTPFRITSVYRRLTAKEEKSSGRLLRSA